MIPQDHHIVEHGAIDDTNNVPEWCRYIFLLIDEIEDEIQRRRTNIVVYALVSKPSSLPVLIKFRCLGPVSIESPEKRECVLIRDWKGRNRWNRDSRILPWGTRKRGVARCRWVAG